MPLCQPPSPPGFYNNVQGTSKEFLVTLLVIKARFFAASQVLQNFCALHRKCTAISLFLKTFDGTCVKKVGAAFNSAKEYFAYKFVKVKTPAPFLLPSSCKYAFRATTSSN